MPLAPFVEVFIRNMISYKVDYACFVAKKLDNTKLFISFLLLGDFVIVYISFVLFISFVSTHYILFIYLFSSEWSEVPKLSWNRVS